MVTLTKRLIWLYFFLLIFEGVFRKWITPGLSAPLLIVRDPVVIGIYASAFFANRLPIKLPLLVLVVLAFVSIAFASIADTDPAVMVYGLRINYLHVPLVFVMADILTRNDLLKFGRTVIWLTLPIGLLMIAQYFSGEHSWLNIGAGGEAGQIRGALGRVRPAGPFSFTTGPMLWFPLATAFVVYGWLNKDVYPRWLLIAATCMIVVAVPISISRSLMFSVLIVMVFGVLAVMRSPSRLISMVVPLVLIWLFSSLLGGEVTESFNRRWEESTSSGIQNSIIKRQLDTYLNSINTMASAPLFGHGIGMGSNVGARFTTGEVGFTLAESEWDKVILELGPILGWLFITYRCWLGAKLFFMGLGNMLRRGDSLGWLLTGAALLPVISGQWAPPTILGFAVFGAGLIMATGNRNEDEAEEDPESDDSVHGDA